MFTGIVRHIGSVVSNDATPSGRRLVIDASGWGHAPNTGDSIACSGCCLTLTAPAGPAGLLVFDAVPETLARTTLGGWVPGTGVNLEAAARVGDRLDGHIVQGHVDGVGTVKLVDWGGAGDGWRVRVRVPDDLGLYLVPKGSIAVDGVSLTLAAVGGGGANDGAGPWFEVALIPETLARTTLKGLKTGDRINIECDTTVKTIARVVEAYLAGRAIG